MIWVHCYRRHHHATWSLAIMSSISLHTAARWKISVTFTSRYKYWVMSYGLVNAPLIFQGFINEVLWTFLHFYMITYINYILIYFSPEEKDIMQDWVVLQSILKKRIWSLRNVNFNRRLKFLGYILDETGVKMDKGKVGAVNSTRPSTESYPTS